MNDDGHDYDDENYYGDNEYDDNYDDDDDDDDDNGDNHGDIVTMVMMIMA